MVINKKARRLINQVSGFKYLCNWLPFSPSPYFKGRGWVRVNVEELLYVSEILSAFQGQKCFVHELNNVLNIVHVNGLDCCVHVLEW